MPAVIETTESATSRVALATAWSHQRSDRLVVESDLGELTASSELGAMPVVVVVELDAVEIVVDDTANWPALMKAILVLRASWTRIIVLVPSVAVGDAHSGLRAAPAVLQQWWFEGMEVRFGVEELL